MRENEEFQKLPIRGDDDFLTRDETMFIQRMLSRPEVFPESFWRGVISKVALDQELIPQSNVQGLRRLQEQTGETIDAIAVIGTTLSSEESSVSLNGATLAAYNPTVTVPAGTYFCVLTGQAVLSAGTGNVTMQMRNTADSLAFGSTGFVSTSTLDSPFTLTSIGTTTLTTAGTIRMWAAEGGNGSRVINNAALVAMRVG